jgi:putative oxidoreductase
MPVLGTFPSWFRSLLRIVSSLLFALHGTQKLFGFFGGMGGQGGTAAFASLPWWAGVIELGGGLLLFLGLFSRPVAFLLSGEMAVAYFKAHFPKGLLPLQNGGELAVLYCFIFLYLSTAGPGPLSLDGWIRKKT